jgi:hypothetical protein
MWDCHALARSRERRVLVRDSGAGLIRFVAGTGYEAVEGGGDEHRCGSSEIRSALARCADQRTILKDETSAQSVAEALTRNHLGQ